jgi:O-antigen ligase
MIEAISLISGIAIILFLIGHPEVALYLCSQAGRFQIGDLLNVIAHFGPATFLRNILPQGLLFSHFLAGISFIGVSLSFLLKRKRYITSRKFLLSIFAIWFFMLIGLSYTPAPIYGLSKALDFMILVVFPSLSINFLVDNIKRFYNLVYTTMILSFLISLTALFTPYMGWHLFSAELGLSGMRMARIIFPGLIGCITLLSTEAIASRWKVVIDTLFIFYYLAFIRTASKGPIIWGTMVILIYFIVSVIIFIKTKRAIKQLVKFFLLFVVSSGIFTALYVKIGFASASIARFYYELFSYKERESLTIAARKEMWELSLATFLQKPLSGIGTGGFTVLYRHMDAAYLFAPGEYPHNIFLEIAVESGLPALLFFLLLIYQLFSRFITIMRGRDLNTLFYFLFPFLNLLFFLFAAFTSGDLPGNVGIFFWAAVCFSQFFKGKANLKVGNNKVEEAK